MSTESRSIEDVLSPEDKAQLDNARQPTPGHYPKPDLHQKGRSPMGVLGREPAAIAAAVQMALVALVALDIVNLDEKQLAAVQAALIAILALFVRQSVVPVQLARERMAEGLDPTIPRGDGNTPRTLLNVAQMSEARREAKAQDDIEAKRNK